MKLKYSLSILLFGAATISMPAAVAGSRSFGSPDSARYDSVAPQLQVTGDYFRFKLGSFGAVGDSINLYGGTIRYNDWGNTNLLYSFSYRTANQTLGLAAEADIREYDFGIFKPITENLMLGLSYFDYDWNLGGPFGTSEESDGWMLIPNITSFYQFRITDSFTVTPRLTFGGGYYSEDTTTIVGFGAPPMTVTEAGLMYFIEPVVTFEKEIGPGFFLHIDAGYRSFVSADWGAIASGPLARGGIRFDF